MTYLLVIVSFNDNTYADIPGLFWQTLIGESKHHKYSDLHGNLWSETLFWCSNDDIKHKKGSTKTGKRKIFIILSTAKITGQSQTGIRYLLLGEVQDTPSIFEHIRSSMCLRWATMHHSLGSLFRTFTLMTVVVF